MKELFDDLIIERREGIIHDQITRIKDYREYEDIQNTFDNIVNGSIYDPSLMLEWNVWRAMTMLDGGNIVANTKFDDLANLCQQHRAMLQISYAIMANSALLSKLLWQQGSDSMKWKGSR